MEPGTNSQPNSNSQDPYLILGVNQGASFDAIQEARDKKLIEAGDDQITKAKIEAAYDSLLMVSLKSRQLGNASNEAINASKKEDEVQKVGEIVPGSLLTSLKKLSFLSLQESNPNFFPSLEFPSGQELTINFMDFGLMWAYECWILYPDGSYESDLPGMSELESNALMEFLQNEGFINCNNVKIEENHLPCTNEEMIFNLQGQVINERPNQGIYIKNNETYLIR